MARKVSVRSGEQRFIDDQPVLYKPYPFQAAFHRSDCKYRLMGGAAGPGKTFGLIMDHLMWCTRFNASDAPQVHTLILRRTYPKLAATVITRFREKIPKELYASFNETKGVVTWHNGATTTFGAMQYEHDVWGYQGQWLKIAYDELTEFTFPQWQNIAAWNRCPVSPMATREGATNPIGIGAAWVEDLFVKHRPCAEMDEGQKSKYNPVSYGYFPGTYLDNPIYANDPSFIASLESYQSAISKALKEGIWGVAGGYFDGAWDEAENVYLEGSVEIKPWWRKWMGGDWGFDHNSAIYWLAMDEMGVVRVYRELVINRQSPEQLGELVVEQSRDSRGNQEKFDRFAFAHDAFAQKDSVNTVAKRMGMVLSQAGLVFPQPSTKDKIGREQILYDFLRQKVQVGTRANPMTGISEPTMVRKLQISEACPNLIRAIGKAPRDEKNSEEIAEFLGDDPLQGVGYALYAMFGKPRGKPRTDAVREQADKITDPLERWNYLRMHLPHGQERVRIHQNIVMPWQKGAQ